MKTTIIPLMFCLDNNYAIPAGVAFYSLLEHAHTDYVYKLYVLHSDISVYNQNILQETVAMFANAELECIDMKNKFSDLFEQTNRKGHYSKEMFYKFVAPSLFPQYNKIIISDVDVVFKSDISSTFFEIYENDDVYFAAHKGPVLKGSFLERFFENYSNNWDKTDISKLYYNACYMVFNLKKMRLDNIEQQCIDFAIANTHRIRQPEQDTLNYICYPKIKELPLETVVCTYVYDLYTSAEDFKNDLYYTKDELHYAFAHPVQLHYASAIKPWKNPACTKAEDWFVTLAKTPFLKDYLLYLASVIPKQTIKKSSKLHTFITRIKDSYKYRIHK